MSLFSHSRPCVGDRVVAWTSDNSGMQEPLLMRVIAAPDDIITVTYEAADGVTFKSMESSGRVSAIDGSREAVIGCNLELPLLDDQEYIDFVGAVSRMSPSRKTIDHIHLKPLLFLVTSIDQDRATIDVISPYRLAPSDNGIDVPDTPDDITGILFVRDPGGLLRVGDFCGAADCRVALNEDQYELQPQGLVKFAKEQTVDSVERYIPVSPVGTFLPKRLPYSDVWEIHHLMRRARAQGQPERALLFAYLSSSKLKQDRLSVTTVATTGVAFLECSDQIADELKDEVPGPGLWIVENGEVQSGISYDHEGPYDYYFEIVGEIRPTEERDLEQFGDIEMLADSISDVLKDFLSPEQISGEARELLRQWIVTASESVNASGTVFPTI